MELQQLAYRLPEFCDAARIGRSKLYEEIAAGRIKTIKVGSRTLITLDEAKAYLKRLADEADAAHKAA